MSLPAWVDPFYLFIALVGNFPHQVRFQVQNLENPKDHWKINSSPLKNAGTGRRSFPFLDRNFQSCMCRLTTVQPGPNGFAQKSTGNL